MHDMDIFDKRLIVLFVLKESKNGLTTEQISKLCSEFDDITYIDICMYIDSLKNSNYIQETYENNKSVYILTDSGLNTLNELIELVPGISLLNMKNILKEKMEDYKQAYEVDTIILPIKTDEYKVSCFIRDRNDELINLTIYAGDKENAKTIATNWKQNSDELYAKIIELMTH